MSKKKTVVPNVRGTLIGFNVSRKGRVQGAVIETARGQEQVNFPKRSAESIARGLRVGSSVDLSVDLERSDAEHRVYRVNAQDSEATGKIARLNYACDGHVTGYHLTDTTLLHVKRSQATRFKLKVGDRVKATGVRRQGPDAAVLDVLTLERIERIERAPKTQTNGTVATA